MEGWWGAPTNVATGVSLRRHDYTARRPSDRRRPLEQAVFALHEASATRIPRSRTPPSCAVKSPSPNSRAERRRHVHVPRRPRAFDTHPAPAVTNPFFKPIFTGVLLDHVDVHPPQVHLGVPARVGNSSPTSSISRSPVAPRGTLCRTIPRCCSGQRARCRSPRRRCASYATGMRTRGNLSGKMGWGGGACRDQRRRDPCWSERLSRLRSRLAPA